MTANGTKIPFLSFADDILIFAKANLSACTRVREILDDYCVTSGQSVNYNKSAFQTTKNVDIQMQCRIQNALRISSSTSLEKYLGCPIINGRVNRDTFEDLVTSSKDQLPK